jgi:uncharacterized protein YkwD
MKYLLIFTLAFCFSCSTSDPDPIVMLSYEYTPHETDMIFIVNQHRIDHSLSPLQPVEHISSLCKQNNDIMVQTGVAGHYNFQDRIENLNHIGYSRVSEIITYNYVTNQSSLSAIKNDPRCAIILNNSEFTNLGLSLTISPTGKRYYTLIFVK